ncbi:MAG: NAD(P)/FAD-dependent oxidoreductase [Rhodobacteraceae bacterium]|nr:NAD(P)/FAD-dependent oxidoreductase [Paracoccaceae bacterium]
MTKTSDICDILIVGARCAGSAIAILLARAGLDVRLVEQAPEIGDTLSTHALMRPGVAVLDRLGVLRQIVADGTPTITRTRFAYGSEDLLDIAVKPKGNAAGLYAPRRSLLDRILCQAAVEAGAHLSLATRFETVIRDRSGRVVGAEVRLPDGSPSRLRAGLVIGADGRLSAVARSVEARCRVEDTHHSGLVYGYFDDIPNEGYRWFFDHGLQVGLIPTNGGQHCVFAACRPSEYRARLACNPLDGIAGALAVWAPEIAARLAEGATERMRRFPGAPGHIRDCAGPGWALVGDAGYYKDPATAHGITDALLDAVHLAAHVLTERDAHEGYQALRDAHADVIFPITQRIASFDWTFDELAVLHRDLNDAMRWELASIESGLPLQQSADRAESGTGSKVKGMTDEELSREVAA